VLTLKSYFHMEVSMCVSNVVLFFLLCYPSFSILDMNGGDHEMETTSLNEPPKALIVNKIDSTFHEAVMFF